MLAFKLEDGKYGQLTYIRIYQGEVKKGDTIFNMRTNKKVKVGRLVRMHSDKMEDIEQAGGRRHHRPCSASDCASGDTFTDGQVKYSMRSMFVPDAVIYYAVEPKDRGRPDPTSPRRSTASPRRTPPSASAVTRNPARPSSPAMGELHLDVYIERMKREYKVEVIQGAPQVAYRETISQEVPFDYTHKKADRRRRPVRQDRGHHAPRSATYKRPTTSTTASSTRSSAARSPASTSPSCDNGFQQSMEKGVVIGFPVTDVEMELNDGNFHPVDSSDMAFQVCARQGFKEAMKKAKPVVMEPVMKVQVEGPEEFQGTIQTTLIRRRGNIHWVGDEPTGTWVIDAHVPLSEMFGYSTELRSGTQGKAEYTMEFAAVRQGAELDSGRVGQEVRGSGYEVGFGLDPGGKGLAGEAGPFLFRTQQPLTEHAQSPSPGLATGVSSWGSAQLIVLLFDPQLSVTPVHTVLPDWSSQSTVHGPELQLTVRPTHAAGGVHPAALDVALVARWAIDRGCPRTRRCRHTR